ncbi:hypothetical protein BURPS1655_D1716 [Burkholderia pseudomallei 1655]|nr:hypothetical protein BURPS1655_D1716 [Burkholderia pseudomallei 1655]
MIRSVIQSVIHHCETEGEHQWKVNVNGFDRSMTRWLDGSMAR